MPDLQITMANHISASAAQSALSIQELVTTMKTAGMADSAIRQTLLNDLNTGGPLFGSFRNKLKNTVKNGVEASSNGSANGKFTKAGVSQFQWVSVGDGKVCPDCEERHGETGTMEYFETIGLPASGFSVCTTNCRCQLLPENYKGENLDKPLVKEKGAPLKVTDVKMAGKHKVMADARKWAVSNGVIHNQLNKMPLDYVNEINVAISKMPKRYRRDLVVGDFAYFNRVTGQNISGLQMANFGVSATMNASNAKLLTVAEKIAMSKAGTLGTYRVVGINSKIYKTLNDVQKQKRRSGRAYFNRTGHKWGLDDFKGSTMHHEFGHIVHEQLSSGMRKDWDDIAKIWVERAGVDMIKKRQAWTESYGEAFAEAWATYTKGNRSLLPNNVIEFLDSV